MISIKEWQLKYKNNYFNELDIKKIIEAGWVDWYCNIEELIKKTKKYSNWILKLCDSSKIALESDGFVFKNKYNMLGLNYDSITVIDIISDKEKILIDIYMVDRKINYDVYKVSEYYEKIFETTQISELISFLNK